MGAALIIGTLGYLVEFFTAARRPGEHECAHVGKGGEQEGK